MGLWEILLEDLTGQTFHCIFFWNIGLICKTHDYSITLKLNILNNSHDFATTEGLGKTYVWG